MVSSVFDAMEAVGVAGEGMNRLINRDGGGTGPDDAPDLNRGGSGGHMPDEEGWYGEGMPDEEGWYGEGKGKGKGKGKGENMYYTSLLS